MRMWHRLRNLPVGSTTRVGGSVFPRVSVGGQWFSGNVSHAFPVERVRYAIHLINNNHDILRILPPDSSAFLSINRSRCR
jgi:hypothetical protein